VSTIVNRSEQERTSLLDRPHFFFIVVIFLMMHLGLMRIKLVIVSIIRVEFISSFLRTWPCRRRLHLPLLWISFERLALLRILLQVFD
jgi:hypothetical protein